MANQARLYTLLALAGATACGGASTNDFSQPVGSGGSSAAGNGGTSAKGGSTSTGGSGGSDTGGTGGSGGTDAGGTSTGGSNAGAGADGASGGTTGGTGADGGSGGTTGGTGAAGGMAATGGSAATGGASAGTGGTSLGGAGGATGGSAGRGNGGSGGTGTSCTALMKTYQDTLTAARACDPKSGKDQCTLAVPESAVCGCEVYANPDNQDAIAELMSLRQQAAMECMVACPAIACIAPMPSNCRANPTGDGGQCTPGGVLP